MSNAEQKSPLTIIAIFAGIIEASALASLPFLSEDSQSTYTWFLVGFPFFLTVLFFLTLNFNYKSLYFPSSDTPFDAPLTLTSPLPPQEANTSATAPLPATMEVPTCNEAIDLPLDSRAASAHVLGPATQPPPAIVTITTSGASASQLLEHFTVHAISQSPPLCTTWILCNLETGTRITLTTQPIDR